MAAALSSSRCSIASRSSTSSSASTSTSAATPLMRSAAARIVPRATPTREKADATPPSGFPLPTESSADDRGSLFPRRNPGSFPSPALASALERLSIELLEGADTGAVSPPGGGEAAFDPLRDGPARYLGYSNECGYVVEQVFFSVFLASLSFTIEREKPTAVVDGGPALSRPLLFLSFCSFRVLLFATEAKTLFSSGGGGNVCISSLSLFICLSPLRFLSLSLSLLCSLSLALARSPPPPTSTSTSTKKKKTLKNFSEAFAAWLPPFGVPLSYAVAIGYVVVDTIDKGLKAYSNAGAELEQGVSRPDVDVKNLQLLLSLERATDTIVWQLLASVFVPGFTIHTVVQAAHAALLPVEAAQPVRDAAAALASSVGVASADALLAVADKSIPTAVGLAAIPFIVHPIDNAIHALLNVTLRPALKKFVCEQGKGKEAGLELCEECGPWKRPAKKEGGGKKH